MLASTSGWNVSAANGGADTKCVPRRTVVRLTGGQMLRPDAADGRVSHTKVVHVMDLLRREDVSKFAINVDPEDVTGRKP